MGWIGDIVGAAAGAFSGGGVGILLRMGQGFLESREKAKEAERKEAIDQANHRRELETREFEMKHAAELRKQAADAAEELARIDAGRSLAAEDAETERETLKIGNTRFWSTDALAHADWTGGLNRLLMAIVNFLAGLVRPVVTFAVVAGYLHIKYLLFKAIPTATLTLTELNAAFAVVISPFDTSLIGTIVGFWFADRSLGKSARRK